MDGIQKWERALACFAHAGWVLGGIGLIVAPLLIWLVCDGFVSRHARQAAICQCLLVPTDVAVSLTAFLLLGDSPSAERVIIGVIVLSTLVCLAFSLMGAVKALNGEEYMYPIFRPFFKGNAGESAAKA